MASEFEPRVTALETAVQILDDRVRTSEHDSAAAQILAGVVDRNVTQVHDELRALREQNNRLHNAHREDLIDLRQKVDEGFAQVERRFAEVGQQFAKVDQQFAQVDQQFAQVDQQFEKVGLGFATVRGRLDAAAAGQEQIVALLNQLIDRQGPDDA